MKALIIEDNREQAIQLRRTLANNGFASDIATTGETGLAKLMTGTYAFAIVDIMLPDTSGYEVITRARDADIKTALIVLSAMGSTSDKVLGLNQGADDYIAKPFAVAELIARINAVLRRTLNRGSTALTYNNLRYDPATEQISYGKKRLVLTEKERRILLLLLQNVGHIMPSALILDHIWGITAPTRNNIVENMISRLRKKFKEQGISNPIKTLRGIGYTLK